MDPVAGVRDVLDVGVGEQPLDLWVIVRAGWVGRESRVTPSHSCINHLPGELLTRLPDVRRTGSAQKQRRPVIRGVKAGEAHDVF